MKCKQCVGDTQSFNHFKMVTVRSCEVTLLNSGFELLCNIVGLPWLHHHWCNYGNQGMYVIIRQKRLKS
jgi:hypothetical protein